MERSIQIDVIRPAEINNRIMECNLYVTGSSCVRIYMALEAYQELMRDGVFIRNGEWKDSAGVLNTTNMFKESI